MPGFKLADKLAAVVMGSKFLLSSFSNFVTNCSMQNFEYLFACVSRKRH